MTMKLIRQNKFIKLFLTAISSLLMADGFGAWGHKISGDPKTYTVKVAKGSNLFVGVQAKYANDSSKWKWPKTSKKSNGDKFSNHSLVFSYDANASKKKKKVTDVRFLISPGKAKNGHTGFIINPNKIISSSGKKLHGHTIDSINCRKAGNDQTIFVITTKDTDNDLHYFYAQTLNDKFSTPTVSQTPKTIIFAKNWSSKTRSYFIIDDFKYLATRNTADLDPNS